MKTQLLTVIAAFVPYFAHADVNVYSSRHYPVDEEIFKKFTATTGVKVNHVQVKEAGQLIERLKLEGDKSPADVLFTVDIGNLYRAAEAGVLQPASSTILTKQIPETLRDPKGLWFAVTQRARVIAYNKNKVKPDEIKRYEDLADAKWKGRIVVRTSNHVYNQSLIASFIHSSNEKTTENWIQAITNNLARKPQGGDTDQLKAIAQGMGDVAIVNSYYASKLISSKDPEEQKIMKDIALVFPNQSDRGTHINVSGGGLTQSAKNKAEGIKLLEFFVSEDAQKMLAEANQEYPVVAGIDVPSGLKAYGKPKFDETNLTKIANQTPTAVRLADKSGWR